MNIKNLQSLEFKFEKQKIKEEFEKQFNANNWVEVMSDQEYISEYSKQYGMFIHGYYLSKKGEKE